MTQREKLKFNGMKDSEFVALHGFYFEDGEPCKRGGFTFPIVEPSKVVFDKVDEFNTKAGHMFLYNVCNDYSLDSVVSEKSRAEAEGNKYKWIKSKP